MRGENVKPAFPGGFRHVGCKPEKFRAERLPEFAFAESQNADWRIGLRVDWEVESWAR